MKAEELADGALVVTQDGSPLTKFMLGVMVVFLETAWFVVSGVSHVCREQSSGSTMV